MSYSLEIFNKLENKKYQTYKLNNQDNIGIYENESFEIVLKNNTLSKVHAIISLNDIDVLNGKIATLEITNNMFVVEGYESLKVSAWPDNYCNGSNFMFSNNSNGIISVAVFSKTNFSNLSLDSIISIQYQFWPELRKGIREQTKHNIINKYKNYNRLL